MKKLHHVIVIAALILASSPAWASTRSWEMDKGHSSLVFQVNHIFSKIFGLFHEFDANIRFDPAHLEQSSIALAINVDSIDTNISKRDKHLLSADFFDAGKFPQMTFTSTSITQADGMLYNVVGTLTIKGKPYELTLPMQYLGPKEHPMKKGSLVAGFNIDITLDRLAYDVGDGKFFEKGIVGKDVAVQLSVEALSDD